MLADIGNRSDVGFEVASKLFLDEHELRSDQLEISLGREGRSNRDRRAAWRDHDLKDIKKIPSPGSRVPSSKMTANSALGTRYLPVIHELQRHAEIVLAQHLNHALEIVFVFSRNANLIALDRRLYFDLRVLDLLDDRLRFL